MKVTETILDPNYEVGSVHFSDEHEGAQYFTNEGKRIPYIEREVVYKPDYDAEAQDIEHWFYKREVTVYRDVTTQIAKFRVRNIFDHLLKSAIVRAYDKYLGRFL